MKYTKPKAELITFEVTSVILDSIDFGDGGVWSLRRNNTWEDDGSGDSGSNGSWE